VEAGALAAERSPLLEPDPHPDWDVAIAATTTMQRRKRQPRWCIQALHSRPTRAAAAARRTSASRRDSVERSASGRCDPVAFATVSRDRNRNHQLEIGRSGSVIADTMRGYAD